MKVKEMQRINGIAGVLGERIKRKVSEIREDGRTMKDVLPGEIEGVGRKKLFLIKYCLYLEKERGQEILSAGYEEVLGGAYVLSRTPHGNIKLWFKESGVEGIAWLVDKDRAVVLDRGEGGFVYYAVDMEKRRLKLLDDDASTLERDRLFMSMFYLLVSDDKIKELI